MSGPFPEVALRQVVVPVARGVAPQPGTSYRQIGVRLWGEGTYEREPVDGGATQYATLYEARTGDLVVNKIWARNGSVAVVDERLSGGFGSGEFPMFAPTAALLPRWAHWLTKWRPFWERCAAKSQGTSGQNRIKPEQFLDIAIPLPPLPEQQRIVARIDELAELRSVALLLRRDSEAETRALVGARADTIFSKLLGRSATALSDMVRLERGKFSHRPRNDPRFFGGDHPWIQIAEIEGADRFVRSWSQTLNDEGLAVSKKFPAGTVLVSIAATIGAVAILDFDCCVPDSVVGVTPHPGVDTQFVYHYMRFVREHLEKVAPQSAQKNVNLQILSALRAPVASPAEQRAVVSELDAVQSQVTLLLRHQAQTRTDLVALLPAILDRAFAGAL